MDSTATLDKALNQLNQLQNSIGTWTEITNSHLPLFGTPEPLLLAGWIDMLLHEGFIERREKQSMIPCHVRLTMKGYQHLRSDKVMNILTEPTEAPAFSQPASSDTRVNVATSVSHGDAALVLQTLRNHTVLSQERLKALIVKHLESDDSFDAVWEYIIGNTWVDGSGDSLRLSSEGREWLDNQGTGLTVEDEDTQSEDTPTKPYEVAKLKMETKHFSVFQALRKIEKGEINLNPEFQRAFVWDLVRQSRLIESILIRIPLPAFYLDATDQVRWNVVDGLQRLSTLNRYCREQSFALTGLQFLTELENKRFDELPPQYRVLIEDDTQLLFYNLMPGTPVEAKFTIFSRVNTGGMQLTAQEIRHALSQGKVTDLLGRLAKHEAFRSATEGVVESLRMSDRELVLRALAFMHLGVESYKRFNELDAFLLYAMSQLNTLSDEELESLGDEFLSSVRKVSQIFGRYSFRKFAERGGRRSPFNKALFEVWTVSVRHYEEDILKSNKDKIIDGFLSLMLNKFTFVRAISSSTGSSSAVSARFTEIEALLKDICQ